METLQDIWGELGTRLRRFVGSRVNDPHVADDIMQDVMLKVQTQLDSMPPEDKLPAWVFAIARNAVIDHYRARAVRDHADIEDVELVADDTGVEQQAAVRELTPCLLRMVEQLPEPYREAMKLADFEGLPDASVDVVISNCVINLAPNKSTVFREIGRVLKPGGRVAVSDIALKQPLPEEIAKDVMAYVGCISGALLIDDYRRQLAEAGFSDVVVVDAGSDLNAYAKVEGQSGCCSPAASTDSLTVSSSGCCGSDSRADKTSVHDGLAGLLGRYDVNEYAASVKVYAVRPR